MEDDELRPMRAPSPWLQVMEQRALLEAFAGAAASPFLPYLGCLRRGVDHPVLVLPGFTASDRSTIALRRVVRQLGYHAHRWHLGANLGPTHLSLARLVQRVEELERGAGRRVSLVGWSLGGIYARELARRHPDLVRQVITLGSPFRLVPGDRTAATWLAERIAPDIEYAAARLLGMHLAEHEKDPMPVPSTAVYTRADGVVRWHSCIDVVDDTHENVEVHGSHSGLGFNPTVLYVVADRLAQRDDKWRPFRPPAPLRRFFPTPVSWCPPQERRSA